MTRHARLTPGAVVAQGDQSSIDARIYQTVNVKVSVEDRAQILAEVGAALRPVLAQLVARVEQLEDDNRALTDTLASIAALVPARQQHLDAIGPGAPPDVGTQPYPEPHADPCPAGDPLEAPRTPAAAFFAHVRGDR